MRKYPKLAKNFYGETSLGIVRESGYLAFVRVFSEICDSVGREISIMEFFEKSDAYRSILFQVVKRDPKMPVLLHLG